MQPLSPPPAPPPVTPSPGGNSNPYSFLFEEPKKSRKKLPIPSGNSTKQRILLVVGGAILFIIVISIVMSFLNRASSAARENLKSAIKQQAEIVRIAETGTAKARDSKVKNWALTTNLGVRTSQSTLTSLLNDSGDKISPKELAAAKNTETDTLLTNAEQSNNFDAVFSEQLVKQLNAYRQALQKTYDSTGSDSAKKTLADAYKEAGLLLDNKPF